MQTITNPTNKNTGPNAPYLSRLFVLGVNDDADQKRRSAGSVLFKYLDLLQYSFGYHTVRKTQDRTSPENRESYRSEASGVTISQNVSYGLSQNLKESVIIMFTT